jgi:hypothetical protein
MRKAEFLVPSEAMLEFTDAMASRHLDNSVTGTTTEGEIVVEVSYEREENNEVDELEKVLEKIREEMDEEKDEEEEEDEK